MMSDGISAGALQPDADELLFDDWLGAGLDKAIAAVWTAFRFQASAAVEVLVLWGASAALRRYYPTGAFRRLVPPASSARRSRKLRSTRLSPTNDKSLRSAMHMLDIRQLYPDSARIRRPPLPNGAIRILPNG